MKHLVLLVTLCLMVLLSFSVAAQANSDGTVVVTEPTPPQEEGVGSTIPRIILLLPKVEPIYVSVFQFFTHTTTVTVNVTVENDSPYSTATLFYRITSLDTNRTVRDWSKGESVLLKLGGKTNLTITTTVPTRQIFQPDHYKLEAKLALPRESITAETTFTVEKTGVQEFLRNTAVLSLCCSLLGLAYYSYKAGIPKPWKKYPEPKTT